jgi:hypothetical protein
VFHEIVNKRNRRAKKERQRDGWMDRNTGRKEGIKESEVEIIS